MKIIIFYSALLAVLLISNTTNAQDTLTLKKGATYSVVNQQGVTLAIEELLELANKDSILEAYTHFNKADNIELLSYTIGLAGAAALGYAVAGIILNGIDNKNTAMLGSGAVLTAIDLLLVLKWHNKELEKGVNAYNEAKRKRAAP